MTKFQKDWSKSVKNLLESAYFTMKGDTLLKAAKSEGSTKAINKFKESLNRTGVSRKTKNKRSRMILISGVLLHECYVQINNN